MTHTPTARIRTWTLVLVSLGLFMAALDTLVVTTSPAIFVEGFKAALWVGAGVSAGGVVAAVLGAAQRPATVECPAPQPGQRALAGAVD